MCKTCITHVIVGFYVNCDAKQGKKDEDEIRDDGVFVVGYGL
jgi:hypothetical protein